MFRNSEIMLYLNIEIKVKKIQYEIKSAWLDKFIV
jgi:hypothetical protein